MLCSFIDRSGHRSPADEKATLTCRGRTGKHFSRKEPLRTWARPQPTTAPEEDPWTASYTYDDGGEIGVTSYNTSTAIVPGFVVSGNGSTTGESTNFQVASQVARSKSWRSTHTQTLRNAANGSCDLAAGKQTANCYVIQAPGTYTFPLVYGNALNADGSSNDNSYKTATFVDHNGIQINSPYIYSTNGGTNVPYDAW